MNSDYPNNIQTIGRALRKPIEVEVNTLELTKDMTADELINHIQKISLKRELTVQENHYLTLLHSFKKYDKGGSVEIPKHITTAKEFITWLHS